MMRKTIHCQLDPITIVDCYISVSCYATPYENPPRLLVQLLTVDDESKYGPIYTVASVNLPHMPAPPARAFYMKTWSENKGLLEQLVAAGAIQVLEPAGVPVGPHDAKAVLVQLLWSDCDMEVNIPEDVQRKRSAEDTERFLCNTYVMHLGM